MIENPVSAGIEHVKMQYKSLSWIGARALPSAISWFVLSIVLAVLYIMWPYGVLATMEDLIRELMAEAKKQVSPSRVIANVPYVVALGLYFLVWLPFWLLCTPMFLIGVVGKVIAEH